MSRSTLCVAIATLVFRFTLTAHAGFANSVVHYVPGDIDPAYRVSTAALGAPVADTGFGMLTPFSAAYQGSHIAGIGQGGTLVLELGALAPTGHGATLGVHAGVGIQDRDFPNGSTVPTADLYTNPRSAQVLVSDDNVRWFALGQRTFDIPTNYFSQGITTPGLQFEPGTVTADFEKPFTAALASFDNRSWAATLALLDGSAGGEWLDLTAVPYPFVRYIRFDVTGAGEKMYVDAVAVVPEPGAAALVVLTLVAVLRSRR